MSNDLKAVWAIFKQNYTFCCLASLTTPCRGDKEHEKENRRRTHHWLWFYFPVSNFTFFKFHFGIISLLLIKRRQHCRISTFTFFLILNQKQIQITIWWLKQGPTIGFDFTFTFALFHFCLFSDDPSLASILLSLWHFYPLGFLPSHKWFEFSENPSL